MTKTIITRTAILSLIAAAAFVMPGEAMASIAEQASAAAQYLDELAIGAVIIGALVALDTASWSWMTARR